MGRAHCLSAFSVSWPRSTGCSRSGGPSTSPTRAGRRSTRPSAGAGEPHGRPRVKLVWARHLLDAVSAVLAAATLRQRGRVRMRRMSSRSARLLPLVAALATLAGCGGSETSTGDDKRTALSRAAYVDRVTETYCIVTDALNRLAPPDLEEALRSRAARRALVDTLKRAAGWWGGAAAETRSLRTAPEYRAEAEAFAAALADMSETTIAFAETVRKRDQASIGPSAVRFEEASNASRAAAEALGVTDSSGRFSCPR